MSIDTQAIRERTAEVQRYIQVQDLSIAIMCMADRLGHAEAERTSAVWAASLTKLTAKDDPEVARWRRAIRRRDKALRRLVDALARLAEEAR